MDKKEERPKSAHVYLINGKKYYYTNLVNRFLCSISVEYLGWGILPRLETIDNNDFLPSRNRIKSKTKSSYFIDGMLCCYCEKKLTDKDCTREHILPKSKGGKLILPACKKCNGEKSNMIISEYISFLVNKNKIISHIDKIKISNAIHVSMTTNIS